MQGSLLRCVPDLLRHKKCVMEDGSMLRFVPANFIKDFMFQRFLRKGRNTPYGVEVVNNIIERLRLRKFLKSKIYNELLPISWHPDRVIDWCFDEEEKKDLKQLWGDSLQEI